MPIILVIVAVVDGERLRVKDEMIGYRLRVTGYRMRVKVVWGGMMGNEINKSAEGFVSPRHFYKKVSVFQTQK